MNEVREHGKVTYSSSPHRQRRVETVRSALNGSRRSPPDFPEPIAFTEALLHTGSPMTG